MKKRDEWKITYIKSISLYREDIELLYDTLKNNCEKFEFGIDEYNLDNINEIPDLKRLQANELKIMTNNPNISLNLTNNKGAQFIITSYDQKTAGLYSILNDILKSKQNKTILFINRYRILLAAIPTVAINYYVLSFVRTLGSFSYQLMIYLLIDIIPYISLLILLSLIHPKFSLSYKKDTPPFFERNKDRLISDAMIAIFSLVLGILFGRGLR